jgi:ribonuclease HI
MKIFTDGGSRGNPGSAASAFVVYNEADKVVYQEGIFLGAKTNNEAEYGAVLGACQWLIAEKSAKKIDESTAISWFLDSMLVVEQLSRHWKIKDARMQALAGQIWQLLAEIKNSCTFTYVPRAQNAAADRLVNETLDNNS